MGVVECMNHNLVEPFNVLFEREGELDIRVQYGMCCVYHFTWSAVVVGVGFSSSILLHSWLKEMRTT